MSSRRQDYNDSLARLKKAREQEQESQDLKNKVETGFGSNSALANQLKKTQDLLKVLESNVTQHDKLIAFLVLKDGLDSCKDKVDGVEPVVDRACDELQVQYDALTHDLTV